MQELIEPTNTHTCVVSSTEARDKLLIGLNRTADAVGSTLGPHGRCVLIQRGNGKPILTKDGVTVSKSINPKDPLQRLGSMLIQESAERTNDTAGDGTTTATVLTQAMVNECSRLLVAGHNKNAMLRGLNVGLKHVVSGLKQQRRLISSHDDVKNVATISTNGDGNLGGLIATAIERVTSDGIIMIEDAKGMETSINLVDGMMIDRGYISSYFVNNKQKMISEHENCRVLVTSDKVDNLNDIINVLNEVLKNREPLLIIADDVAGTALQTLLVNRSKQNLPIVAIRAPGYGDSRNDYLNDICILTGATLVGSTSGNSLSSVTRQMLGTCKKVSVDASRTVFVCNTKDNENLNAHIASLKLRMQDVTLSSERLNLIRSRIANLVNGVAIVRVGGATEFEAKETCDRVEDALNATRAAIDEGVVEGGGMALLRTTFNVDNIQPPGEEIDVASFNAGLRIVQIGCEAPLKKIAENAGKSFDVIKSKVDYASSPGYDALNDKYVNLHSAGIIDPVKVTRCAFENACSVAMSFIQLNAVVYEES